MKVKYLIASLVLASSVVNSQSIEAEVLGFVDNVNTPAVGVIYQEGSSQAIEPIYTQPQKQSQSTIQPVRTGGYELMNSGE